MTTSPTPVAAGAQSTATATTLSPVLPTGWAAGDVVYYHFTYRNNGTKSISSGWTKVAENQFTSTHWSGIYRRVMQTGDTAPTLTVSVSDQLLGESSAWRGCNPLSPEDVAVVVQGGSSAASFQCKQITAASDNTTILAFASTPQANALALHAGTVYTAVYSGAAYDSANGSHALAYVTQALAGVSARATYDQTVSGPTNWNTFTIALRPAPDVALLATIYDYLQQAPDVAAGEPVATGIRFVAQLLTPFAPGAALWADVADTTPVYDGGALWAGPGAWVDITSRVRGVHWERGREEPGGPFRVGTAALTLENLDGELSPWNDTSSFTYSGNTTIRAGLLVRFGFLISGVWEPAFAGELDTIDDATESNADAWVTFNLVETLARVANYQVAPRPSQGLDDSLTSRVNRLLNDAAWPYGTTIDAAAAGTSTLLETTMTQSRLADMALAADSVWFFDSTNPDPVLAAEPRILEIRSGRDGSCTVERFMSTADIPLSYPTFTNDPVNIIGWPMVGAVPYANSLRVLNLVTYSGPLGGGPYATLDDTSVSLFGPKSLVRDDIAANNSQAFVEIADALILSRGYDDLGIEQVTLNVDMDPTDLWPWMAALDVNQYLSVSQTHPSEIDLTIALWVDGYTADLTPIDGAGDATFVVTLATRVGVRRTAP